MKSMSNIGMATLPRERFGSLTPVANASFGQAVTHTIESISTSELYVNVKLALGGQLQAALTDPHGLTELPGYELKDSRVLSEPGLK